MLGSIRRFFIRERVVYVGTPPKTKAGLILQELQARRNGTKRLPIGAYEEIAAKTGSNYQYVYKIARDNGFYVYSKVS